MQIRKEELPDYDTVYRVVQQAFEQAEHADGNEADLVTALRKGSAFIPELSLVAELVIFWPARSVLLHHLKYPTNTLWRKNSILTLKR